MPITAKISLHAKGCNYAFYQEGASDPFAWGQFPVSSAPEVARRLAADPNVSTIEHDGALELPHGATSQKLARTLKTAEAGHLASQWLDALPTARPRDKTILELAKDPPAPVVEPEPGIPEPPVNSPPKAATSDAREAAGEVHGTVPGPAEAGNGDRPDTGSAEAGNGAAVDPIA